MEENNPDEIEICQNIEPHEDDNLIKSKAVVKFATVQVPAKFTRLQCNTDLNLPPSNWLSNSPGTHGLHKSLYHSPGFASFRMAHMFPDCLGEVDVVSDAENIKTLLKLPYAPKTPISMMVHKIGNTLLIDEFDIQKYLLRKADDDWKWLRTFIIENILSSLNEKDRNFCLKDKSRRALQRKNLLSKFLYHSLQQSSSSTGGVRNEMGGTKTRTTTDSSGNNDDLTIGGDLTTESRPLLLTGPMLPEPNLEENVPDPNRTNHVFNRNVVWTFEDIRMLIGTDMPIFGGGTRPCVSLRLRDMTKSINVLTGIDYWLDNLMCNVPEVVMCYHLDGIVQKYELIKTEDLPYLEDSRFSPQVVRNVAQNILAFLKVNATKAGHTYWLFKGKNDDVVKLYDLTTLCKNNENNDNGDNDDNTKYENPFTVPVAMLLYTVARNMKNSSEKISSKKASSIKTLLDNCVQLLSKEKYPQIVTSSHYILSDLHIPAGIDPISPNFDNGSDLDSDTQSVYDDDYNSNECDSPTGDNANSLSNGSNSGNYDGIDDDIINDMNDNIAVKSICETLKEFNGDDNWKNHNNNRPPSPLAVTIEERCKIALQHISSGIDCLQYFTSKENENNNEDEEYLDEKEKEKQRIVHEEQNPNMAKPFQPIPLPYETLQPKPKIANPNVAIPMGWQHDKTNDDNTEKNKTNPEKIKKNKGKKEKLNNDDDGNDDDSSSATLPDESNVLNDVNHRIVIKENSSQKFGTWNNHLKLLLLEKACLTYTTLAEHNYVLENYGTSLKCIYMAFRCQHIVINYIPSLVSQKSCLLGRAGDCLFQFAKNWQNMDVYMKQYENMSQADIIILNQIKKDSQIDKWEELPEPTNNIEYLMTVSCKCYDNALELADSQSRSEILRRLGSVRNELGVKYMHWAQEEYTKYIENLNSNEEETENGKNQQSEEKDVKQKNKKDEPLYQILSKKSYDNLIRGVAVFEEVDDTVNLAFLLCNMGRFMRFRAHIHLEGEECNNIKVQKKFYNSAFTYYQRALNVLGTRKQNPELWDLVNWELSTAMFTLAKQVQDFSDKNDLTSEEVEREIIDLLQKSLKLCDITSSGPRQVLYTYRSGLIHYRLGSFHHSQLLKTRNSDDTVVKTTLQLCRLHYEKASKILENLKEIRDYLTVQLKRIAVQEFLAENSNNNNQKIKSLQIALEICHQTKIIFDYIIENGIENLPIDEILKLLKLFENRLQYILRTLAKLCLTKINSKELNKMANVYKQMYSVTLKKSEITDEQKYAEYLSKILENISQIEKSNK